MSQVSAQDRERAVQAITRRNMLLRRIKHTQQAAAAQGEARQALQDSLAADQAALAEAAQTVEEVRAEMRREEERTRRETQESIARSRREGAAGRHGKRRPCKYYGLISKAKRPMTNPSALIVGLTALVAAQPISAA